MPLDPATEERLRRLVAAWVDLKGAASAALLDLHANGAPEGLVVLVEGLPAHPVPDLKAALGPRLRDWGSRLNGLTVGLLLPNTDARDCCELVWSLCGFSDAIDFLGSSRDRVKVDTLSGNGEVLIAATVPLPNAREVAVASLARKDRPLWKPPKSSDFHHQFLRAHGLNLVGLVRFDVTNDLSDAIPAGCGPEAWVPKPGPGAQTDGRDRNDESTDRGPSPDAGAMCQDTVGCGDLRSWGFSHGEVGVRAHMALVARAGPVLPAAQLLPYPKRTAPVPWAPALGWRALCMHRLMAADAATLFSLRSKLGIDDLRLEDLMECCAEACLWAQRADQFPPHSPWAGRLVVLHGERLARGATPEFVINGAPALVQLLKRVWAPRATHATPLTTLLYHARGVRFTVGPGDQCDELLTLHWASVLPVAGLPELAESAAASLVSVLPFSILSSKNSVDAVSSVLQPAQSQARPAASVRSALERMRRGKWWCLGGMEAGPFLLEAERRNRGQVAAADADAEGPGAELSDAELLSARLGLEYVTRNTPAELLRLHGFDATMAAPGLYSPDSFCLERSVALLQRAPGDCVYLRPLVELLGPLGVPWLSTVLENGVILVLGATLGADGWPTVCPSGPVWPLAEERFVGLVRLTQVGLDWLLQQLTDGFLHRMVVRAALFGCDIGAHRTFVGDWVCPWLRGAVSVGIAPKNALEAPTLYLMSAPVRLGGAGPDPPRYTTVQGFLHELTKPWVPQADRDLAVAWLARNLTPDQAELGALLCTVLEYYRLDEPATQPPAKDTHVPPGCRLVFEVDRFGGMRVVKQIGQSAAIDLLQGALVKLLEKDQWAFDDKPHAIHFFVYPGHGSLACYSTTRSKGRVFCVLVPEGRIDPDWTGPTGAVSVLSPTACPLAVAVWAGLLDVLERYPCNPVLLKALNVNQGIMARRAEQRPDPKAWSEALQAKTAELDGAARCSTAFLTSDGVETRQGGTGKRQRTGQAWGAWRRR